MEKQVDAGAYEFSRYVQSDRWASYFYQLREVLGLKPETVLEIGAGDGVFGSYLEEHGVAYTSADIAEDLHPDIVASVTDIPLEGDSFDVVCAFEVLEHLPFDQFDKALSELARVAKKAVIISLPHFGPPLQLEVKVPFLPRLRFAVKIPFPKKHVFNGQHYWEIGKRGYPVSRIRKSIEKHFTIGKEFVPFENQYHHFFVLKKRDV